jgi:hypothetical protein
MFRTVVMVLSESCGGDGHPKQDHARKSWADSGREGPHQFFSIVAMRRFGCLQIKRRRRADDDVGGESSMRKELTVKTKNLPESDPQRHVANIRRMLNEVLNHCREDVEKVSEPKAQVLFETTAEVLHGLETAYEHYAKGSEPAMRP